LHNARADTAVINKAMSKFLELNKLWNFKTFPKYEILLTLYGTGGSFNANTGTVIMLTRRDGTFRRKRPHETIIHEIVHIGIHDIIVSRYKLEHWEKERLVDLICLYYFGDILPEYKLQRKGDNRLDEFVNTVTINDLPASIENYIKKFPRNN